MFSASLLYRESFRIGKEQRETLFQTKNKNKNKHHPLGGCRESLVAKVLAFQLWGLEFVFSASA